MDSDPSGTITKGNPSDNMAGLPICAKTYMRIVLFIGKSYFGIELAICFRNFS